MLGSVRLFCWQPVGAFPTPSPFPVKSQDGFPFRLVRSILQAFERVTRSSNPRLVAAFVSAPRARTCQSGRASVRLARRMAPCLFLMFLVSMPHSTRPSLQLSVASITRFIFGATFLSLGAARLVADRIPLATSSALIWTLSLSLGFCLLGLSGGRIGSFTLV